MEQRSPRDSVDWTEPAPRVALVLAMLIALAVIAMLAMLVIG